MKLFTEEAAEALDRGQSLEVGAIKIACDPPVRIWGGYQDIVLDGETYVGVGNRALVTVTGGALGVAAEGSEIIVSRTDAPIQAMLAASGLWRAPVVIWRLIFDKGGRNLLDAKVHQRGRLDKIEDRAKAGGEASLALKVEGAARGQGRTTGRMRSDADQVLIRSSDGFYKAIAAFGERQLVWGGRRPRRSSQAMGGGGFIGRGDRDGLIDNLV